MTHRFTGDPCSRCQMHACRSDMHLSSENETWGSGQWKPPVEINALFPIDHVAGLNGTCDNRKGVPSSSPEVAEYLL